MLIREKLIEVIELVSNIGVLSFASKQDESHFSTLLFLPSFGYCDDTGGVKVK